MERHDRVLQIRLQASIEKCRTTANENELERVHGITSLHAAQIKKDREDLQLAFHFVEEQKKSCRRDREMLMDLNKQNQTKMDELSAEDQALHARVDQGQAELAATQTQITQDKAEVETTLDHTRSMVETMLREGHMDDVDDKIAQLSIDLAELRLKHEHFDPQEVATQDTTVQTIQDSIASRLAESSTLFTAKLRREGLKLLLNRPSHMMQGIKGVLDVLERHRTTMIDDFVLQVLTNLETITKDKNRFVVDARDVFRKKLQQALASMTSTGMVTRPKDERRATTLSGRTTRKPLTSTCVACDRPLEQDETELETTTAEAPEEQDPDVQLHNKQMRQNRVVSSFQSKRIDTSTPIKGRSGRNSTTHLPRPSGGPNNTKASNEGYVYRGGVSLAFQSIGTLWLILKCMLDNCG